MDLRHGFQGSIGFFHHKPWRFPKKPPAVAFRPKAARQGQATQGQRAMAIAEETLADLL